MTLQIATLLLAFAVLGYVSFVFDDDRWKRTFYALIIGNVIVGYADAPVWITYATTAAVMVFFVVMLWQSRRRNASQGSPTDLAAKRATAKAKLAEAKSTGDYSKLSDADVKYAGLAIIETADDTIQLFPHSTHVVEITKDGTTSVIAPLVPVGQNIRTVFDQAGITYQEVAP